MHLLQLITIDDSSGNDIDRTQGKNSLFISTSELFANFPLIRTLIEEEQECMVKCFHDMASLKRPPLYVEYRHPCMGYFH